jgi:hypothetical protein
MLAERSVRRLSIRAPDAALARRGAFLIEDALRTASLPGDGGELVLLRRLRLPPFAAARHRRSRWRPATRGCLPDGGGDRWRAARRCPLAAAAAVRFADALTAHLAADPTDPDAGRARGVVLAAAGQRLPSGAGRCSGLAGSGAVAGGAARSPGCLAALAGAAHAHGDGACARLLSHSRPATSRFSTRLAARPWRRRPTRRRRPGRRRSTGRCGSSAATISATSGWHDMARRGVAVDHHIRRERGGADHGEDKALATRRVARHNGGDGGDKKRCAADAFDAALAAQQAALGALPAALPAATPAASSVPKSPHAADMGAPPRHLAAPPQAAAAASDGPPAPVAENVPGAGKAVASSEPSAAQSPATAPEAGRELTAPPVALAKDSPSTVDKREALLSSDAATAAGGLLLLVPLLNRLGLADFLGDDSAPSALPQRIFATLLRRLAIADADPLWLLCVLPLAVDREADGEAVRWLGHCRRHLRRHVGIGLYSLVCRPARIAITATHVDVRQDLNAVDLRIRRAGLDVDPGWVPWLGRVLRFHYGRDQG